GAPVIDTQIIRRTIDQVFRRLLVGIVGKDVCVNQLRRWQVEDLAARFYGDAFDARLEQLRGRQLRLALDLCGLFESRHLAVEQVYLDAVGRPARSGRTIRLRR